MVSSSHLSNLLYFCKLCREDVLILSSSGTAAVCNLGFMAELDTSGHCLLPGRLQVTDSKSIQVSPPPSVLCPVVSSGLFLSSRKQLRF